METEVGFAVLENTVPRTLTFLRAAATHEGIHAALAEAGYGPVEHDNGWVLLHKVSGYKKELPALPPTDKQRVRAAMVKLDGMDEATLGRIDAPLKRFHPEQHAFVFDGLTPTQGTGSVLTMSMLCDRLDALESGPEREATRQADHAALATLESRGITTAFRAEVRELVKVASSLRAEAPPAPAPFPTEQTVADLKALRAWYVDWAQTARSVIGRRDWLIRLGLAKRKKSAKEEPEGPAMPEGGGTQ